MVRGRSSPPSLGVTFDDSRISQPLRMAAQSSNLGWRGIPEGMLDEDEDLPPASARAEFPSPEPRQRRRIRIRSVLARALFAIVFGAVLALLVHEILLIVRVGARPF